MIIQENEQSAMYAIYGQNLHGLSMFAVEAKIFGVLYKQSSSKAFDEKSSYWSEPKNS